MKTLILMRHAKSTWKEKVADDHDRPLSKRGKKDAPRMGELLKEKKLMPDLIIASTAVRTHHTVDLVIEEIGYRGDIYFYRDLYMGEMDVYMARLRVLPDSVERVLVVGHNPSLDCLLQILTSKVETLPSAAVAQIELPIDSWKELDFSQSCELMQIWKPKEIN